jgi:uncharacterized phage infection (PIP) family protein YhgE
MAKEQKQQIELVTVQLSEEVVANIKQHNDKLNELVSVFGQLHLRRKELEDGMTQLEENLQQAEDDFKSTNNEMQEALNVLERDYPRGQIDLQEGTVTYNPAIKEQAAQSEGPAPLVEGDNLVKE